MKASDAFTTAIDNHLKALAKADALFAETLKKPTKNITDCCTYIMNAVKANGANAVVDSEVYNMAVHYYDEDDLKPGAPVNGKVVVGGVPLPATDKITPKICEPRKTVKKQTLVENQPSLF